MDLWQSLSGMVLICVTTADPPAALRVLEKSGVTVFRLHYLDELTFECLLPRSALSVLSDLEKNCGAAWRVIQKPGLYWKLKSLFARPVLLIGIVLIMAFWLYLPTRIFFFQVEGNESVPTALILEKAADCGIGFGASRREVRSEKMKNALLSAIPELQWAGINTAGCVATISVRERQTADISEPSQGVSSIVAARDGIIQSCTVTRGSAVCRVGQAVKAGQVLISGYTDSGLAVRGEQAKGEISALTNRKITLLAPVNWSQRGEKTGETKKFSLLLGKKRINFYEGSGILDTGCVKMYEENYLTLPGGFQLPIAIVVETWSHYSHDTVSSIADGVTSRLPDLAQDYLQQQMVAGQILYSSTLFFQEEGIIRMEGKYSCAEIIGVERNEEMIIP